MLCSGKNGSQRCAVSRRRTIATVRRAVTSWCRIFDSDISFQPRGNTCASLMKEIKEFLASCPTEDEESRMAFQSIKKLLPASCICMEEEMLERLCTRMLEPSTLSLPSGYLAFARRMAKSLFPVGWDTTYRSHVQTIGPTLKSTLQHVRHSGGGTAIELDHSEFLDQAYGLQETSKQYRCCALVVQSAGKPRPLTKYDEDVLVLKPLHKAMYDRLSQFDWLLRGDVTASALDNAGFNKGRGALVSGDYKSASDNLPLAVAEAILDVALENASRVPETIRESARALLRPMLGTAEYTCQGNLLNFEEVGEVVSGQQMGSLLCFPLLCAQNYIAFRWAVETFRPDGFQRFLPKDLPVLINGDDILFQVEDPRFFDAWISTVQGVGLEVERTKTSFADDFGSLNSTLVRWRGTHLRVVPTVRMGMLRSSDYVNSLSTNFQNFVRGLGARAYECAWQFFSWHKPSLIRSSRTLRELGFRGALAWRVASKMRIQRVPLRDRILKLGPPPPAPTFHNFVLSKDDVDYLPEVNVSQADLRGSNLEMASWKWSLRKKFRAQGSIISYLAALSRPGLQWSHLSLIEHDRHRDFGSRLTWRRPEDAEKELYFAARPPRVKCLPFFRSCERLPAYSEIEGDAIMESGPINDAYFEHRWALSDKRGDSI